MRLQQSWLFPAITGLSLAVLAAGAIADSMEVKARQEAMKSVGGAMKAIKSIVEAGGPAADIAPHAQKIAEAAARIPMLWPQGSDAEDDGSRPEIWTAWDKFLANAKDLETQAGMLAAAAAGGDMATAAAQFEKVGGACGQCHQDFRVKK